MKMLAISRWNSHSGPMVWVVCRVSWVRSSRSRWTGLTACMAIFSGRCT